MLTRSLVLLVCQFRHFRIHLCSSDTSAFSLAKTRYIIHRNCYCVNSFFFFLFFELLHKLLIFLLFQKDSLNIPESFFLSLFCQHFQQFVQKACCIRMDHFSKPPGSLLIILQWMIVSVCVPLICLRCRNTIHEHLHNISKRHLRPMIPSPDLHYNRSNIHNDVCYVLYDVTMP